MTTLLIVFGVLTGSVVGWFGHKAIVRIQTWGEKMNEQDMIFQAMSQPEEWPATILKAEPSNPETPLPRPINAIRA